MGFVSPIILTDSDGFCNRVGKDFQIWVYRSVAAAPAKEIEGLGQLLLSRVNRFFWGGGKGTSAFEMVLSPLPRNSWGCSEKLWVSKTFWFWTLFQAILGKGAGTISNAEVSRPLPLGRKSFVFGFCCPIPCPPWLGFIAVKLQFPLLNHRLSRPLRFFTCYFSRDML